MRVLVTGAAGFIGMHTALRLLERGDEVVGFDSLNAYYDPALKAARLERLQAYPGFTFVQGALEDRTAVAGLFADSRPDRVVNLAAQAGVRYSIEDPQAYVDANLVGFANVHGLAVRGRENRNGLDAESPAAPDDSTGDLSAVGYQDPAEHQDLSHQLGERF